MCSFFLGAKSWRKTIFNPFFVFQSVFLSFVVWFLFSDKKVGIWFLFLTSSELKDWAVVHVLQSSFWCRELRVGRLFVHFENQHVLHLFSENAVNIARAVDPTYTERDTFVLVLSLFTTRYMVADLFSLRDSCWNTVYAAAISNNTDLGVCSSSPRCCSNCRGVYNLVSIWFSFWCLVSIHQRILCCTTDYCTSSCCWCDLPPCEFPPDLRGSLPFKGRDQGRSLGLLCSQAAPKLGKIQEGHGEMNLVVMVATVFHIFSKKLSTHFTFFLTFFVFSSEILS